MKSRPEISAGIHLGPGARSVKRPPRDSFNTSVFEWYLSADQRRLKYVLKTFHLRSKSQCKNTFQSPCEFPQGSVQEHLSASAGARSVKSPPRINAETSLAPQPRNSF